MEKLRKPHIEEFPSVTLFLDDIEKIISILKELSNEVEIKTSEYSLEGLHEFSNLNADCLNELHLCSRGPYVSLDLEPYLIRLYIGEDELTQRGAFNKIKDLLISRRRKFAWLLENQEAPAVVGTVSFMTTILGIAKMDFLIIFLSFVFLALAVFWSRWSFNQRLKRYSIIHLAYKRDKAPFLKRNMDSIAVAVISTMILSMVGWMTKVLQSLISK